MDIFNCPVPPIWLETLARIQEHVPSAVLAGGCLRDLVFGGTPKDLDVFFDDSDGVNLEPLFRAIGGLVMAANEKLEDYSRWANGTLSCVFEIVGAAPLPINLIGLRLDDWSIANVLDRMDIGACQVGTNGKAMVLTQAFLEDAHARKFTIVQARSVAGAHASLARLARFRARFGRFCLYDGRVAAEVVAAAAPGLEEDEE